MVGTLVGIGVLLSLPLLDGGRRESGMHQAGVQLDEALALYRAQGLQAFKGVEDQLAALHLLQAQAQAQQDAVAAAQQARQLSDARYRHGYVSQLELLAARRSELRNQRLALQVRAEQHRATVALVRALGGWEAPSSGLASTGPQFSPQFSPQIATRTSTPRPCLRPGQEPPRKTARQAGLFL